VVYRELARQSRMFPFVEMLLFIVLVLAGFFYIWKKGVLDWSHEAMKAFREDERPKPLSARTAGPGYTLTEEKPAQLIEK
jgi:hypothetical protein